MVKFKKGQSFKNQRVYVANFSEQTGANRNGMNVAFSMANDTREGDDVFTDPMLVYDKYMKDGQEKKYYKTEYSANQWEKIMNAANKEGPNLVVDADLMPNSNGPGLVVNTNTLKTPEIPFDREKHMAITEAAREAKKAKREEQEIEKEDESELSI
ncbi:hypothetical protein AB1I68_00920 [Paenibacillus pabuli]|uniref:hypothetical protein n=1 Tax=Paenibacillus pabuli TaxID=1472 RepID=UPI00345786BB